jgi:hypothetical protein
VRQDFVERSGGDAKSCHEMAPARA